MRLWLTHRAWNLFRDLQRDCLGRRGTFLSCDFVLPRTGTFWQYGFPSSILRHFFPLGANLGLGIEWAEACRLPNSTGKPWAWDWMGRLFMLKDGASSTGHLTKFKVCAQELLDVKVKWQAHSNGYLYP